MKNHNTSQSGMPGVSLLQHRLSLTHHILAVEDDCDVRRLAVWALIDSGLRVDAAENGADAWESIQFNSYDLLIADQKFPC